MNRATRWLGLAAAASLFAACEQPYPRMDVVQTGFRGLGIEYVENPRMLEDSVTAILSRVPVNPPAIPGMDPAPAGTWENVQVLGHLSEVEFTLTMQALTNWVAPEQGCAYCHVYDRVNDTINYASDQIYTKIVSRRMLQMTQDINVNWRSHVGEEKGVNCWTCHQGQPVPTNYWFFTAQNQPLRHYFDRDDLRVQGEFALAREYPNRQSIKQTEYAYSLMMSMSNALGVNCTYCHNSARFADWTESSPARVTALRGLRMIREANVEYMLSLQNVWPTSPDEYASYPDRPRLGPLGDGPKLRCSTCHIGAYKPQYNHEASYSGGWRAIEEIGYPNGQAPMAEGEAETAEPAPETMGGGM